MKIVFTFVFLIFIAGAVLLYMSSRDVLDIAFKTGQERRDALVTMFEQQLVKLESNYYRLRETVTMMSAKAQKQYAQLSKQIELLDNIIDGLEDTDDEIRWKILRRRYVDRYNDANRTYRLLERASRKLKQ